MTEWEKQDKGWYTSELGGIAQEADRKWYFYPIEETKRSGPFKTMKDAVAASPSR